MFSTLTDAQRAVSDLMQSGYARNAISILVRDALAHRMPRADDPREHGPLAQATNIIAGGPLGDVLHRGHATVEEHAVTHCLATAGLQQSAAQFFTDAICRGAIVVAVHCRDGDVACAREILDVHHAAGPESRDPRQIH
jgi:hypothetical protein